MNKKYTWTMFMLGSLFPILILMMHFNLCEHPFLLLFSCVVISLLLSLQEKQINRCLLIFILLIGLYYLFHIPTFLSVLAHLYNALIEVYNSQSTLKFYKLSVSLYQGIEMHTIIVLVLFHLVISFLYKFCFDKKQRIGCIIVLWIALLPVFLVSIHHHWSILVFFIAYNLILLIPVDAFTTIDSYTNGIKQSILVFVSACIFLSAILFVLPPEKEDQLYQRINFFENINIVLNEMMMELVNGSNTKEQIDLMDAKDRSYYGKVHASVQSELADTFYLKKQVGCIYEDNKWIIIEDKEYKDFDDIVLASTIRRDEKFVTLSSNLMDFRIKDYRVDRSFSLFPYSFKEVNVDFDVVKDRLLRYQEDEVTFRMYKDLNRVSSRSFASYEQFVMNHYLQIPEEMKLYLEETFDLEKYNSILEKEYYFYDRIHDATPIIMDILEGYEYTLTPGETPQEEDFVQYFLSTNKKGYCVHFATSATLLFRYFGIPARFVEGYRVQSSSFKLKEEGYEASVLDEDAHAWVEVYDPDDGWSVIEVTIGQNREENQEEEIEEEEEIEIITPEIDSNQKDEIKPDKNPIVQNAENEEKSYSYWIVLMLILLPVLSVMGRKWLFIYHNNKSDRKEVCYSYYRYLSRLNNYEDAFNEEILYLFKKNKFSKHGITEAELDSIKTYSNIRKKEIYKRLNFIQKMKFIFIDGLL